MTDATALGGADTVSVVICTYASERWDDLLAAVRSAVLQRFAALETIVVVDHNADLLARIEAELAGVIAVPNSGIRGLSGARNSGVRAARGSIVAFLDDDARAEPTWLERLVGHYANPSVMGVGGRVEPGWVAGRPAWFPSEFDWVVGCSYRGAPEESGPVRNLIGANMSFRRALFNVVGGFDSGLGRVGKLPVGCEETEFCIRTQQRHAGSAIVYEPLACVHHCVPVTRARWRYYTARCYAEGRSKAAIASMVGVSDSLSSERAHTMRALPRGVARGFADASVRGDASGLGRAAAIAAGFMLTTAGFARGTLAARRVPCRDRRPLSSSSFSSATSPCDVGPPKVVRHPCRPLSPSQ
jgi:GT2 family glycosyltransferase